MHLGRHRSGVRQRHQRTAQVDAAAGSFLDVWTPDAATWQSIQAHTAGNPATLTITGYQRSACGLFAGADRVHHVARPRRRADLLPRCSADAQRGRERNRAAALARGHSSHPLAPHATSVSPESRTVLTNMPTCANCHSFSARRQDHGHRRRRTGKRQGPLRCRSRANATSRFRTRISCSGTPTGRRARCASASCRRFRLMAATWSSTFAGPSSEDVSNTYYVTNFKDYRFLQVFYPTRGILEWYNRAYRQARSRCPAPTIRASCRRTESGAPTANTLSLRAR